MVRKGNRFEQAQKVHGLVVRLPEQIPLFDVVVNDVHSLTLAPKTRNFDRRRRVAEHENRSESTSRFRNGVSVAALARLANSLDEEGSWRRR